MRRRDDEAVRLPNEVVERLNTKGIPKPAVEIRKAEGVEMTLTTRGCNALADRMDAERRVFESSLKLEAARGLVVAVEDLRATIVALEEQVRTLRHEKEQLLKEVERQTARGAMAISSGGTER